MIGPPDGGHALPKTAIAEIIARALSDPRFRKNLIRHPDQALAGYDLSREEIALIASALAKDQTSLLAAELDERVSKVRLPLGFLGDAARVVVDAEDLPDMPVAAEAVQPEASAEPASRVARRSIRPPANEPTEATVTVQDEPTSPGTGGSARADVAATPDSERDGSVTHESKGPVER